MIKPKYYDRETAPLIYYKIICGVLTVGVVLGVLSLIFNIIALFNGGAWWLVFAEKLVFLVIAILALDGLKSWKWRGVRWLGMYFLLYLLDSLAAKYIEGVFDIYDCSVLIAAWLLWFIPSAIYFKKRRPLFTPPIGAIPQAQYEQQNAQMKQYIVDESTGEIISESPVIAVQEDTAPQLEQINKQPKSSDPPPNESTEENRQEQNESDETTQTQDEAEQVKHRPTYKVACIVLLLVLVGVSAFSIWDIYGLQQQLDEANDTLVQELNRSAENGNHGMRAVDIMPRLSEAENDDDEIDCNGGETEISAYQTQQGNREKETTERNEQIEQLNREVSVLTTDKEALANRIDSLENELEAVQRELDGAQQELEDTLLKVQATDNFGFEMFQQLYKIGFIVDGSSYYHLFTCSIYKDASTYWAHNIEYCESLGYSKCPLCWNVS